MPESRVIREDVTERHFPTPQLGHGPRRAVASLWLWTALLSALVLYPVFNKSATNFAPFGLVALVLFLYTVLHPDLNRTPEDE